MISRMAEVKVEQLTLPQRHKEQQQETNKQSAQKHAYDDDEISLTSKHDDGDTSHTNDSSKSDETIIEHSSDSQQIVCSPEFHKPDEQAVKSERLERNEDNTVLQIAHNLSPNPKTSIDSINSPPVDTAKDDDKSAGPRLDRLATTVDNSYDVPTNQEHQKEPRYEEIIIDGFAICAFNTWEELQDEVNEQIALHKANESRNVALAPVAKSPRKSSKSKLKTSKIPDDAKSDESSAPTVLSAKRKLKLEKQPKKRTKKSSAPQPTSTTSDTDNATKASKNSQNRKKDKATTSKNEKISEVNQSNLSRNSNPQNGIIKTTQNSNPQHQLSPQVRNQQNQAIHSHTQGDSYDQRSSTTTGIANSSRKVNPTQENNPNIDRTNNPHLSYGNYSHDNQNNRLDNQSMSAGDQNPQSGDAPSQPLPNQAQNQTPNSQGCPPYPAYFYHQHAPNISPYQQYGGYAYPPAYQSSYPRQQPIPQSSGYYTPSAYPTSNYQYPTYSPYHYPPPLYPGMPAPVPPVSSNQVAPNTSSQLYQAPGVQYNQNTTPTGPNTAQYPAAYPGYSPYVVTNTTISRQTSIIPPQLPHIPTSIPYHSAYGQPAGLATSPQNRFSSYHTPQALLPTGQALSNQFYNGHNLNAATRACLPPVPVQLAKSIPPSPIKNSVSTPNGSMPAYPPGTSGPLNNASNSPSKSWPSAPLDHQWAARYGLIGSMTGPRVAFDGTFMPGFNRMPTPMRPPSPH